MLYPNLIIFSYPISSFGLFNYRIVKRILYLALVGLWSWALYLSCMLILVHLSLFVQIHLVVLEPCITWWPHRFSQSQWKFRDISAVISSQRHLRTKSFGQSTQDNFQTANRRYRRDRKHLPASHPFSSTQKQEVVVATTAILPSHRPIRSQGSSMYINRCL